MDVLYEFTLTWQIKNNLTGNESFLGVKIVKLKRLEKTW